MATSPQPLPNLADDYRPSLFASAIVTYVLATGAVILRFVARRLQHLNFWWDDWLVVVAWAAVTVFFGILFSWIHVGLGVHYQTLSVPYTQIVYDILLRLFIEDLFYSTGTVFCKLSLLAFYWRIFKVANIRWPIRILATCTILWLIARYIAITLHCIPVAAYWDKTITHATCHVNDTKLFMGTNTVNFFIDLCVLILPMPYIKQLQIKRSQKIVVFGMFTLGAFIVAVSIILLVTCYELDSTSPDITWNLSPIALWAGTEINLGCVTACLPSLRPIFTFLKRGAVSRTTRTDFTAEGSDSHGNGGLRSRGTMSFASRGGRTVKAFSGVDKEDKHHPFSIINDRKKILEEDPASNDSNVDLEELQPPHDKVMVREDFSVNYSTV